MSFHHKLLIITRPIQKVARKIGCKLGFISPNRLRVLLYHDISFEEEESFYNQLVWLKKNWNIVTPLQFEEMISGKNPIIGNNLLITFDDGLASNRVVAEKILNPMGIKAIFFVISEFIKIKDHLEARKFVSKYIIPESNIKDIPNNWRNLQWHDLSALISQGHAIGHHTKMHKRLSECISESELEEEIVLSAKEMAFKLDIEIKHFAYTFGDIDSFSKEALLLASSKFNFVHSGLRGNNEKYNSPLAIRRDAATSQLSNNEYIIFNNKLLDAFLDGFADFRYISSRKKLDSWIK
jgi:peptidoglycan/xylan/chitin deacetylase (PgdA/CDA1 family)